MFKNLRKIRKEKNIKAKEIAKELGLKTEGAYYKKETGSVPFTLNEGKIISNILNMPIEEIFFKNKISQQDKDKNKLYKLEKYNKE